MTWPNPTKSLVPTLNSLTQLAILIRLKQALLQKKTEIWTVFNLLRVIIRICINIALLILLLSGALENSVFYVPMKQETIRKVTQALLSLKLFWNLKKGGMCLPTFICLLMAYRFICVMCFIPKIFLCLISLKQMHTFVLLNMLCQYFVYGMSRKYCRKVLYCDTNEISKINIFSSIQAHYTSLNEYIP